MSERTRRQVTLVILAAAAVIVVVWSWLTYRDAKAAAVAAADETRAAAAAVKVIRLASGRWQHQPPWSESALVVRIQEAAREAAMPPAALITLRPRRLMSQDSHGRAALDVTLEVSDLRQLGAWLQAIDSSPGLRVSSIRLFRRAGGGWSIEPVSVEYRGVEQLTVGPHQALGG